MPKARQTWDGPACGSRSDLSEFAADAGSDGRSSRKDWKAGRIKGAIEDYGNLECPLVCFLLCFSTIAGNAGMVAVTAQNQLGNTLSAYGGTVHFSSSDVQAVLPADYFCGSHSWISTAAATRICLLAVSGNAIAT
jgi:hypothetical protein